MSRHAAVLAIALIPHGHAAADSFCVSTPAQLQSALAAANASPEASVINVVTGVYDFNAPAGGGPALQISGNSSLTISGGFAAGCPANPQINPELTLLRVANTGRLLDIQFQAASDNNVVLTRLGFRQGMASASNVAGCITAESDAGATGRLTLLYTAFRLCGSSSTTSALRVLGRGLDLELKNSVFADNASTGGVIALSMQTDSTYFLVNNTIAFNPRLGAAVTGPAGIQVGQPGGGAFLWLINNIIHGNGSGTDTDVLFNGEVLGVANHNLIGRQNPFPAGMAVENNSAASPQLPSSTNLRPPAASPARNSGNNAAASGVPARDLDNSLRPQGPRVDIGAYEFIELFASGFED